MHFDSPTLTVAIALAAGMVAQALAAHLRAPGIVLLLATGVVLGPDVAGVVRPDTLGSGLLGLVGFAVAVILFEGGLNLDVRRLRRAQRPIRQLVTVGALVTAVGGTLVAKVILGWDWRLCILFGTLVIVTGPTVITPLLKRLNVQRRVATVLEAEGVLIDAIGAITAAVAMEVALSPSGTNLAAGVAHIGLRLGFGVLAGLVGGGVLAVLLRFRHVIPDGLENVLTLGVALTVFELSNAIMHESGIAAVTVAGIVVGNSRTYVRRELAEFKEQLTVLLIGMLFVLLAADVRLASVLALGWPGIATVAALILLVRPLNVLAGTVRTDLTLRERAFVAWIGPRGIVAAAVASLFALELEAAGIAGGAALRALVFLVITVSVLWAGLTGGLAARALGLRRQSGAGWVVLGGGPLARKVAEVLGCEDDPVVCVNSQPDAVRAAEEAGLRALLGNPLEERTIKRAELDTRRGALAVTGKPEVNLLFAQKAKHEARSLAFYVQLRDWTTGVTHEMVDEQGMRVLFGAAVDVDAWNTRVERQTATVQLWERSRRARAAEALGEPDAFPPFVAIARRRKATVEPVDDRTRFRKRDRVAFLIDEDRREQAEDRLRSLGWTPAEAAPAKPAEPEPVAASA